MDSLAAGPLACARVGLRGCDMTIGEIAERVYLSLIGVSALIGIYGFLLYRNSWRWRQLAASYPAPPGEKPDRQHWTNLVLTGVNPAWNSYSGITLIGVNRRGVFLRLLPPFSFLHEPLFFPHHQVSLTPTRWLLQEAYEIQLRGGFPIRMIINAKAKSWIERER